MKLFIEKKFYLNTKVIDNYPEVLVVLKDFSVMFEFNEYTRITTLLPQKITLTEWDMNHLFSIIDSGSPYYTLNYVFLGGEGCDFAIKIEGQKI